MAKNQKKWYKVGAIWKNDEGKLSIAMDLAESATLKLRQGDKVVEVELVPNDKGKVYLQLQKPEDELAGLLASGYITEDVAETRKAAIHPKLRYNVVLPPPRD